MASLDAVLMTLMTVWVTGYFWAWYRLLNRVEKHDNKWYDSYPGKEVIARYIEVFGHDGIVSFVWPQKAVRVILGIVMVLVSLLLLVTSFTKSA